MQRTSSTGAELVCRIGYLGDFAVRIGEPSVLLTRTVTVFLEPVAPESRTSPERTERKGVGRISFGLFRPLGFPGALIPYDVPVDFTAPLRKVWDSRCHRPVAWIEQSLPRVHAEFLVFASIEIDPEVGGRRIALVVMAELINRHLSPGGVALLNPFPLKYLAVDREVRLAIPPEEKQRGIDALKRHYARLGLQSVDGEPDLMLLQRPTDPIKAPRSNVRFAREKFHALPPIADYHAMY